MTVTANDVSKVYDGTPATLAGATVDGVIGSDTVAYSVAFAVEDITNVQETAGAITASGAATQGNYTVTYKPGKLTITKAGTMTVEASDYTGTYDAAAHAGSGTASVTEGTTYKYRVKDGDTWSEWSETAPSITNVGSVTYEVKASNPNYEDATDEGTLTVNPKPVTITAKDASKTYDGSELTQPEFTASALETGDTHTFTVVMTAESTITDVGTKANVIATVDGVAVTTGTATAVGNYTVTTADGELEITQDKKELVIESATTAWTYDSKLHKDETYTVTYGGTAVTAGEDGKTFTLSNGDVITITATAAGVTNVSDNAAKNNTYSYTVKRGTTDTTGNYEKITANVGTLSINPKAVTITAKDASKTYDGSELTQPEFTASALETGDTHTFTVVMTAESTITDVGTKANVIATVDGVAVTTGTATAVGNYTVTTANGLLEVEKRKVILTSATDSKKYDGKALTNETITVSEDGFANGEGATYDVTGKQTLVGSSENKFTYTLNEGTLPSNYSIETVFGTLTVTDGTPDDPVDPDLVVKKTTTKSSDYELGEEVIWTVTVTNIYDESKDVTVKEIEGVVITGTEGDTYSTTMAAGATIEIAVTHVITEKDILTGEFTNTATATVGTLEKEAKNTVTTEEPNGHLLIKKETTSEPADGKAYVLGEKVTYKITVTNDGNLTITDITVTDKLTGDEWTIDSMAPGDVKSFDTKAYTVTEADILAGKVVNEATATGTSPDPDEPEVPVDPGKKEDPTEEPNGHLTVVKITTSKPADGKAYTLGEEITYKITVTNDGNLTITDITVTDELTEDEWTIESLAPGEKKEFKATYVVTEEDSLNSKVVNIATAKGKSPDPDKPDVPVGPGEDPEPTRPEEFEYKFVYGMGNEWTKGSTTTSDFRVARSVRDEVTYERFTGIEIDGEPVDPDNYTTAPGSVWIYLKPAYLTKLAEGEHTIRATFTDGDAETNFFVLAQPEPAPHTGDSSDLMMWCLINAASVISGAMMIRRRKKEDDDREDSE